MDILNCNWDQAKMLIFSTNVYEPLVYYSHFITLFSSILLGFFVWNKDKKNLKNIFFLLMTLSLATWVFFNLILWSSEKPDLIMFFWSLTNIVEILMFIFAFHLGSLFINKDYKFINSSIVFFIFLIPFLIFNHTSAHLSLFDLSNCDRVAWDGPLVTYLYYFEAVIFGYFLIVFIRAIYQNKSKDWGFNVFFLLVLSLFLGVFVLDNMLVLSGMGYEFEQYKLFGTTILLALFMFIIARYSLFKVKLLATQSIVWVVFILVFSQFLSSPTEMNRILNVLTLVFVLIFGFVLISSIRKLENQKAELEMVNNEQGVLLHFITHQIKGFFTKTRGIFSMIKEGDYGPVPKYLKPLIDEGLKSDENGISVVMSVLNASNLKEGKVTSFDEQIDIVQIVKDLVKAYKKLAEEKGLKLEASLPKDGFEYYVDRFQITNVFKNIIDNALHYTEKGEIFVDLKIEPDTIFFRVKDTGVGITEEDKSNLFLPGGRGKHSVNINVSSTGYGLFIVKKIIDHYKGHIFVESEGAGKGSAFTILLPIQK